ncbi:MAG TPA: hypothetical protein VGG83_17905 [Trebonia sp.]
METEFVRPVLLGENVLPYRVLPAREAVLPLEGSDLLDGENPRLDLYPGLAAWWRQSKQVWNEHRTSERLTLLAQIDFHSKFTDQLPLSPLRVVYSKAGVHIVAALTDNRNAVIENRLYGELSAPATRATSCARSSTALNECCHVLRHFLACLAADHEGDQDLTDAGAPQSTLMVSRDRDSVTGSTTTSTVARIGSSVPRTPQVLGGSMWGSSEVIWRLLPPMRRVVTHFCARRGQGAVVGRVQVPAFDAFLPLGKRDRSVAVAKTWAVGRSISAVVTTGASAENRVA